MRRIPTMLKEVKDPAERLKGAEKMLSLYYRMQDDDIPCGYTTWQQFEPKHLAQIECDGRRYFQEIVELLCGNEPEILKQLKSRFERNIARMKELSAINVGERMRLPPHQVFPFYDDFRRAIMPRGLFFEVNLQEIDFTPEFVAKGGMATVYRVRGKDGKSYALKLFRPREQINDGMWQDMAPDRIYILRNVWNNRKLFSEKPFIPPRAATDPHEHVTWYLTDFFDGKSIDKILEEDDGRARDKELARIAAMSYAEMLKKLHDRGMLFIDNNWGNILVNGNDTGVCDYDFVTRIDDPTSANRLAAHVSYRFKEIHLLQQPTKASDLEAFALMLDYLFTGKDLINWDNLEQHEYFAKKDRRTYPRGRFLKIPQHLREVVAPMITYPRDESLKADDFIEAVKLDFS